MQKSSNYVQKWVDTISPPSPPPPPTPLTNNTMYSSPVRRFLTRDQSLQSDDGCSSHCSSVESVLELRKPDPEAVLLGLGFGPSKSTTIISRIPSRFLQPSKLLKQIDLNKFLEQYGESTANIPQQHSVPNSPARQRSKMNSN